MKNILILSSPHPHKAAGVVALDLYQGLKLKHTKEARVKMLVKRWDKYADPDIIPVENYMVHTKNRVARKTIEIFSKLKPWKTKVKIRDNKYILNYNETTLHYSTSLILKRIKFNPDVIIVLFMHDFISYQNLSELQSRTNAKIFLYPMDMAPFTGGCHYAWECEGYLNSCGNCPALYTNDPKDQTFYNLKFKEDRVKKMDISLLAANTQLENQLIVSKIFKDKVVFPGIYPLPDNKVFYPIDQFVARSSVGINAEAKVLFFGACSLADTRKGMLLLVNALKIVAQKLTSPTTIVLLIAGTKMDNSIDELAFENIYMGFVQDYHRLAMAYNASDFFISPSLEDSGPTMVLQSMLCKTPVISFDIGFAKEFIVDKENGIIPEDKTETSLANSIYEAVTMEKEAYQKMKQNLTTFCESQSMEKNINKVSLAIGLN